ncbi:MAG: CapA family protein [Acidimicrobiia bacterium]|nr:CapA family protein [Acidimicrobiia bacterium]
MRVLIPSCVFALLVSACGGLPLASSVEPATFETRETAVSVVDDAGSPVSDFSLALVDGTVHAGVSGSVRLILDGPIAGVVSADGHLDGPVVIDPGLPGIEVRLWRRISSTGAERTSFHFGGDTMLARRYLDPDHSELPVADLGGEVVASMARLFAAADHSTLNLESVVGRLPDDEATPGKRWTIQSPPEVTDMLHALGADLAVLGNNHISDWEDAGISSTMAALDEAGLPHVGAGLDLRSAAAPIVQPVRGLEVATLSFLRTTGDFNNDHLPLTGDDDLNGLDPDLDWQYEARSIDIDGPTTDLRGDVRAGDAWQWFQAQDLESGSQEAALWEALELVFPELQDSVARRVHGGPALFSRANLQVGLDQLDTDPDLTIVQIHGGFQYMQAPSPSTYASARASIDTGADLVILHHPHVFAGFEFYNGGLIAWGLGNLVFDQDLYATFATGITRVVFEGTDVVEVSVIPIWLVDYEPIPVVGEAADDLVTRIGVRSPGETLTFLTDRGEAVEGRNDAPGRPLAVHLRSDGLIQIEDRPPAVVELQIPDTGRLLVPPGHVLQGGLLDDSLRVGTDLLDGWGAFDQLLADTGPDVAPMWAMDSAQGFQWTAADGDGHVVYSPGFDGIGRMRTTSRIALTRSSVHDESGAPLQPDPELEIEFEAAASWLTSFEVRLDLYHFTDWNPARYPVNELRQKREFEVTVGRSQTLDVDLELPGDILEDGDTGDPITAMMLYFESPSTRLGRLTIDDVRVIEWRDGEDIPEWQWLAADFVEGTPGSVVSMFDLAG